MCASERERGRGRKRERGRRKEREKGREKDIYIYFETWITIYINANYEKECVSVFVRVCSVKELIIYV